jgi:hypothetical protein
MENGYVHKNHQDPKKEIFVRIEEKFIDISCNMVVLMATLATNLRKFREVGGSNSDIGSEGKPRENEDT